MMDAIESLQIIADEGKTPAAARTSASSVLLQERLIERQRAEDPETLPTITMSAYDQHIANTSVNAPRRNSKKGKHLKKVEKGKNYQSQLASKFGAKNSRAERKNRIKNKM
jgi:hypothetical protein